MYFFIILDKSFVIILIAIAIIGFSSSAYIFSENEIIGEINLMSEFTEDKTKYLDKINKCINENTAAEGTIALNSFSASILQDLHQRAKNANSVDELEFLLNQVYNTTNCKP